MASRRSLNCSFCGRPDSEVEKLVAGPHVYICDRCIAIANRIVQDAGQAPPPAAVRPSLFRKVINAVCDRFPIRSLVRHPHYRLRFRLFSCCLELFALGLLLTLAGL